MSFRTHHRISRQKANYMDNLSVKVLVPSFLRQETSSFIRSDEQISRNFVSKTRDDFSESSFGTHCCPRTEFKKWATGVLVLISGRSCPSAIRNTRALLLTPPELGERALQRRQRFLVIFMISEPNQFSWSISRLHPHCKRLGESPNFFWHMQGIDCGNLGYKPSLQMVFDRFWVLGHHLVSIRHIGQPHWRFYYKLTLIS